MIIFLGIAGSGKTQQSKLLANQFNFDRISVGELLRQITEPAIKEQMVKGDLVDDDLVISVVEKALDNIPKGTEFIIDGFPRTLLEATWISNREPNSTKIIHMLLSPSIATERLKLRNRIDDNEEAITKRFNEYNKLIEPILEVFKSKGVVIYGIDGSKDIETVHSRIVDTINNGKNREV